MLLHSQGKISSWSWHTIYFAIKHNTPSCLVNHYYFTLFLFPGKHKKNEQSRPQHELWKDTKVTCPHTQHVVAERECLGLEMLAHTYIY